MKNYDLLILGPATRDENVDYDGRTEYGVGGAVIFCAPAARAASSPQPLLRSGPASTRPERLFPRDRRHPASERYSSRRFLAQPGFTV